jgi:hypothetical protein
MTDLVTLVDENGRLHKVPKDRIEEIMEWQLEPTTGQVITMVVLTSGREIFVPGTVDDVLDMIQYPEQPICKSIWFREDIANAFDEALVLKQTPEGMKELVDQFLEENPRVPAQLGEWLAECGNETLQTLVEDWLRMWEQKFKDAS